ncbi:sigma 54-interacting transcriptional regulator [candidate division KSB1 bacterium]|nr:sigma 54-interacting transcriptional regulator [candidate division KSB1 bacterium]
MTTNITHIQEHHFQALFEIIKEINTMRDLDALLSRIMDLAMHALEAERGFIILCRDHNTRFEVATARNIDTTELKSNQIYSTSLVKKILETQHGLLSHDTLEDERFRNAASVMQLKIRSMAAVPLRLRDAILGVICVDSIRNRKMFTEQSLNFLEAFANQAALAIENAQLYESLQHENLSLKRVVEQVYPFHQIIGQSPAMQRVFELMEKVARTEVTVLIEGESGTGKELVARAIHAHGPRRQKPFVGLFCGALSSTLLESELFGHKRGAFTGAIADKKGLLEIADGGTFFLDEIADINLALQTELLRVLQEGEIKRVGDTQIRKVSIRFISATNKILEEQVRQRLFREDLYYRLKVISIQLPPLREREQDMILLANHFLARYRLKTNPRVTAFSDRALKLIQEYHWPGNVRELENVVQAALVLTDRTQIFPEHLPISQRNNRLEGDSLNLDEITDRAVRKALALHGGNRTKAAETLGVSVRWLQYRLKNLGEKVTENE